MWTIVMFDLPVDTPKARKAYAMFRKQLLSDGFFKLQYSVYARPSPSKEIANVHIARVERWLPNAGEVRVLEMTDKQFEAMKIFWGRKRRPPESTPQQLEFF
ncbi:CRISPR-associated endonuclease Cas2 [Crateriforma conspicua]|nr:CRISPR-associated endonuclease Cas2 [Crateriforma conspicua]